MGSYRSSLKKQARVPQTDINNFSCFEDLSNELIFELFDYFSFYDINLAFGNRNKRFGDIIDTYPHYLNLQQHPQGNPYPFPGHIRSLKICARYHVLLLNSLNISSLRALEVTNLRPEQLSYVLGTLPLKQLDYMYVNACEYDFGDKGEGLAIMQEEILSLGEFKLKNCVLRMRFAAHINRLPLKLYTLEYLRLDGCQDISIINHLLDRLPNLKYFRVIILQSVNIKNDQSDQICHNNSLTHLTLHICELKSPTELLPLFIRHCANVKELIIYLNPIREDDPIEKISDIEFVNRYEWTRNIIKQHLPQLRNFRIRQRIVSLKNGMISRPYYLPAYQEEIRYPPLHVAIAANLSTLWQKTA